MSTVRLMFIPDYIGNRWIPLFAVLLLRFRLQKWSKYGKKNHQWLTVEWASLANSVLLLPLLMASVNLQLNILTLQIMPAIQWPFFVHFVMSEVILEMSVYRRVPLGKESFMSFCRETRKRKAI